MKLAIFGAKPAFSTPLHVGRPNLAASTKLLSAFEKILDSKWLTNDGCWVRSLEGEIGQYLNVKHCIAVANGTLGLEIAAKALMPECGEVIVPSFTFAATPHALAWQGYKPVFADINMSTHVLDPNDVEAKITDRTIGILGVHTWGTPCAVDALTVIAKKHGLKLFFDSAHAFSCSSMYDGRSSGSFGCCEVFSFHATKFFNTVEGGAITTNDARLAQRFRELRNFGFVGDGTHEASDIGINAKMSELHAAVGVINLVEIGSFVTRNFVNYAGYMHGLQHPNLCVYPHEGGNYQYVVIELLKGALSADVLTKVLRAENVLARRYFSPPCHKMVPYNQEAHFLPITDVVSDRVFVLPTGMSVGQQDVDKICELILYCVDNAEAIMEKVT